MQSRHNLSVSFQPSWGLLATCPTLNTPTHPARLGGKRPAIMPCQPWPAAVETVQSVHPFPTHTLSPPAPLSHHGPIALHAAAAQPPPLTQQLRHIIVFVPAAASCSHNSHCGPLDLPPRLRAHLAALRWGCLHAKQHMWDGTCDRCLCLCLRAHGVQHQAWLPAALVTNTTRLRWLTGDTRRWSHILRTPAPTLDLAVRLTSAAGAPADADGFALPAAWSPLGLRQKMIHDSRNASQMGRWTWPAGTPSRHAGCHQLHLSAP